MRSQQFHVITGASGGGKSTLIATLSELGHSTFPEAALAIMREQKECGGNILPSGDRTVFMEAVLARSVEDYEKAKTLQAPVFFDRGIPEWSRFLGSGKERCHAATARYRYDTTVFVAEPWPEIYVCDHERAHSFEQAARSYMPTISAYVDAGYEVCVIPKASVQERIAFILAQVGTGTYKGIKAMAFTRVAPSIRIFDENKAREFYVDFLGFNIDFEHRDSDAAPLYMQVSKGECLLLLTEHHGGCSPGCAINIETDELEAFCEELNQKNYKYAKPGIQDMPWGSKNMSISDPFGNKITFTNAIST